MNLIARQVGSGTQVGVAYYVKIRESGKAQCLAQTSPAGTLQVENQIGVVANGAAAAHRSVERPDHRSLVFCRTAKTVRSLIGRVERQSALKDDVGLARNPVDAVFRMWSHRDNGRLLRLAAGRTGVCRQLLSNLDLPPSQI